MAAMGCNSGSTSDSNGTSDGCGCCTPAQNPGQKYPKLAELIRYLDSLSTRADLGTLEKLLRGVSLSKADIDEACCFGARGYKRNTISRTDWYELLALCWRSGDVTPIHDHQGVSCAFRVVHGTGTEIRFAKTPSGLICPAGAAAMQPGYVCAAMDADIHQVANMQAPGTDLVTLHIYSPPIRKMNTYEFAAPISAECRDVYKDQAAGVRA